MNDLNKMGKAPRKSGFWRKYALVSALVCAWGVFGVDVFHVPPLYAAAVVALFSLLVAIPVFCISKAGGDVFALESEMDGDRVQPERHAPSGIVEPE